MNRRSFMQILATATGGLVLAPRSVLLGAPARAAGQGLLPIPRTPPEGWDPIAFNRERGNAGAIPEAYRAKINGADGVTKHLGKHLPFVPAIDGLKAPAGVLPLMAGDAAKGYARHPAAPRGTQGYERGHWFDWIELRPAVEGEVPAALSEYADWPEDEHYAVAGGGDIHEDGGRNTVYLAALPPGVASGDLVRVHAHCRYHGEWVSFVQVP